MAERMIIEPVKRIAENYLETRNKVIENCWRMIVGNDTPKQEDGWLEVMNGRQTDKGAGQAGILSAAGNIHWKTT